MSFHTNTVVRDQIQTLLGMIYPPRCICCGEIVTSDFGLCGPCWRETPFIDGNICDSCGTPLIGGPVNGGAECDDCMQTPRPWSAGRSCLLYSGNGRKMVLALKHGDRQEIARPVGKWLGRTARPLICDDTLVVPVPLHWSRLLKRRYNQSALLARSLAKQSALDWCSDLLIRPGRTKCLDGLTAAQRFEMLQGAICLNEKRASLVKGRDVLLVDDVMTSGATLSACANVLWSAGATTVNVVALARVAKET